jgi:hypothetical protein
MTRRDWIIAGAYAQMFAGLVSLSIEFPGVGNVTMHIGGAALVCGAIARLRKIDEQPA